LVNKTYYFSERNPITVSLSINCDNSIELQIFYTQDKRPFNEKEFIRKEITEVKRNIYIEIPLTNISKLGNLRIDFGQKPGRVIIDYVAISGNKKVFFDAHTLMHVGMNQIEIKNVVNKKIELISNNLDPYIVLPTASFGIKEGTAYNMPFLFSFLVVCAFTLYKFLSYIISKYDNRKYLLTNKYLRSIYLSIYLSIMLFPILKIDNNESDGKENRTLQKKPEISINQKIDTQYGAKLEQWLKDHFYKRRDIINIYQKLDVIMRKRMQNGYAMLGKREWLFYRTGEAVSNYQNKIQFSQIQLDIIKNNLFEQTIWLEKLGIRFYIIIPPDKNRVYPQYYPEYIKKVAQMGRGEQLASFIANNQTLIPLNLIYPLKEMTEISLLANDDDPENLLYYKNDTHWNSYAAFLAYRKLMELIKRDFSDIREINAENLKKNLIIYEKGDLARGLGIPDENYKKVQYYDLVPINGFKYKTILKAYDDKTDLFHSITSNQNKKYKVLVIRDSFTIALLPFISETFGEVEYIGGRTIYPFQKKILEFKPDIVILEILERHIPGLLVNKPPLQEVK
jgi:hypothetical protein